MILTEYINAKKKLILGSSSPRRKELLSEMGFNFDIRTSDIEETFDSTELSEKIVVSLALQKSESIDLKTNDEILITADTLVVFNGEILGKPVNYDHAFAMLSTLSGKTHEVYTGICIRSLEKKVVNYAKTEVTFKKITNEEIDYYITNFKPYDKAGAYGIQEWLGFHKIEKITGSYFNVVGLPCVLISEMLQSFI